MAEAFAWAYRSELEKEQQVLEPRGDWFGLDSTPTPDIESQILPHLSMLGAANEADFEAPLGKPRSPEKPSP